MARDLRETHDLRACVLRYEDGSQELGILHTNPPRTGPRDRLPGNRAAQKHITAG